MKNIPIAAMLDHANLLAPALATEQADLVRTVPALASRANAIKLNRRMRRSMRPVKEKGASKPALSHALAFGAPTDISMGWDGTLWAIDTCGAPHIYDAIGDRWQPHGDSIEAAAALGNTMYAFRGGQYITVDLTTNVVSSGPTSVSAT